MSSQTLTVVMVLLFIHWVSDFLTQTDWQANNKSKSWKALLTHTGIYTITMGIGINICEASDLFNPKYWYSILIFIGVMFISHTIIDYKSSRVTSKLYEEGDIRSFFDIIGLDQYAHYFTIFVSYSLLYI